MFDHHIKYWGSSLPLFMIQFSLIDTKRPINPPMLPHST